MSLRSIKNDVFLVVKSAAGAKFLTLVNSRRRRKFWYPVRLTVTPRARHGTPRQKGAQGYTPYAVILQQMWHNFRSFGPTKILEHFLT